MKGIILAGGSGTRLWPLTKATSKQLIPVYDKPMIYYSISTIMLAGIRDLMIVTTPIDAPVFQRLLGDGSDYGLDIVYGIQAEPNGIPEAITVAYEFIGSDDFCLLLGDNIFYGPRFSSILASARKKVEELRESVIFAYHVNDPRDFGVVDLDDDFKPISLSEKPTDPKSNYAITGLYFYSNDIKDKLGCLETSARGELEITDLNRRILNDGRLSVELLGRGFAWFDCGTHESLHAASCFIHTVERAQGFKIACLEEIAMDRGFISADLVVSQGSSAYSHYIRNLII